MERRRPGTEGTGSAERRMVHVCRPGSTRCSCAMLAAIHVVRATSMWTGTMGRWRTPFLVGAEDLGRPGQAKRKPETEDQLPRTQTAQLNHKPGHSVRSYLYCTAVASRIVIDAVSQKFDSSYS